MRGFDRGSTTDEAAGDSGDDDDDGAMPETAALRAARSSMAWARVCTRAGEQRNDVDIEVELSHRSPALVHMLSI